MFLVRLWGQHLVAMRTTVELDLAPLGNIGGTQTGREQTLTASVSSMPRLSCPGSRCGRHVGIRRDNGQPYWRGIHGKER